MARERSERTQNFFSTKNKWTWHPISILVGLAMAALGVVVIVKPNATLDLVAIIVGVVLLVRAVLEAFTSTKELGAGDKSSATVGYVIAGVLAIVGVVMLARPAFAVNGLFYVISVLLILDALTNFIRLRQLWVHNPVMAGIAGLAGVGAVAASVLVLTDYQASWFSQIVGVGVGLFALGLTYLMYGIAATGMAGRRTSPLEGEAAARTLEQRSREEGGHPTH
ncbi:uncharacterized membrane protein HdeD (DUF308 family) [Arcanobacterium wilhelmae]|uniref:Uncharacterized membrane protein HdeD (DUF308 family) n=1 Tax=Arcanobacterium wilhelmae TaxID=1803177 RepID=A0ABT9NBA2_9ACTO|nr:DUF308 domain-containing protein [Arcanobacterium wilhelmae]MDP9800993.1 uncharacterized membrane protein HdeD (DUF308 family) [Arcanobacterium wilhelmae]WFN90353.1 DUF308 domain-containing protein [Arcanobacterium wilhelmae]